MGVLRGIVYTAAVEIIDLAARPVFWLLHRPPGWRR